MPQQPKGTGTFTGSDDDLIQDMTLYHDLVTPPPPDPGWWDRVNRGLISPDSFLNWATSGQMKSVEALEKSREETRLGESPEQAKQRVFQQGFRSSLARTASAASSPISLGTAFLAPVAKSAGVVGTIAKGLLGGEGVLYGIKGAGDVGEGIQEGYKTPGGSQKILAGGAQMLGTAPAVADIAHATRGIGRAILPQYFMKGEDAFIAALSPSAKKEGALIDKLRAAYKYNKNELVGAPIETPEQLKEYSLARRQATAQELNNELKRIAPQNVQINRFDLGDAIRKRVTPIISMRNPVEAKAIIDFSYRVEQQLFNNPIDIATADQWIAELNKRSIEYDNMSENQKLTRLANGDPILGEKALKHALQDQIEAKLSGYKDLKQRWGHWNEIVDQTQTKLDDIARKGTKVSYEQRKAAESLGTFAGSTLGVLHGGGVEGIAGGALGYIAGKFAAHQILNRLESPEGALQRGLEPGAGLYKPPSYFAQFGRLTQPVAAQQANNFQTDFETNRILNQMFGAPK
jgi:hypothetical protein